MLQDNNKNKRIFSAILLSITILITAKELENKIINDKSNNMSNDSEIVYLDDNKMDIDGQIMGEQKSFVIEELEKMIEDGTVIKKQYVNSPFYVYCIKVGSSVKLPSGDTGFVPNGYMMYEELHGIICGENEKAVYVRSGMYHTVKKEQSRNRTKMVK